MPQSNGSSVLHPTGVRQQTTANICGCRRRRPEISAMSERVTARWVLNILHLREREREREREFVTCRLMLSWPWRYLGRRKKWHRRIVQSCWLIYRDSADEQERLEGRRTSGELSTVASQNAAVFIVMPNDSVHSHTTIRRSRSKKSL